MGLGTPTAMEAESTIVKVVTITIEYEFTPDHLEFRNAIRYRLRLENAGVELHEFTAPASSNCARSKAQKSSMPIGATCYCGPPQEDHFRPAPEGLLQLDVC